MNLERLSFFVVGIALLAIGGLLLPEAAHAQGSDRRMKVGGKVVVNGSRVRGIAFSDNRKQIDFRSRYGFSFGGLLAVDVHPNLTFQPEFLYSKKKVEVNIAARSGLFGGVSPGPISEIDADFFEIPMLVKLHRGGDQRSRFFILGGATISFLTGAERMRFVLGVEDIEDIEDELIGTGVSITIGGGVDLVQDWGGVVTLDARYDFSLRALGIHGNVNQDTFAVSFGIIF